MAVGMTRTEENMSDIQQTIVSVANGAMNNNIRGCIQTFPD
jgi:hypothetical protein